MSEAYWFPVELLVIQAAIIAGLEVAWRLTCWRLNRRAARRVSNN